VVGGGRGFVVVVVGGRGFVVVVVGGWGFVVVVVGCGEFVATVGDEPDAVGAGDPKTGKAGTETAAGEEGFATMGWTNGSANGFFSGFVASTGPAPASGDWV